MTRRRPRLKVLEERLSNGLAIRLLPGAQVPACSLYLAFRVGTRNERPGIIGISHLFEHMYFNGAEKYGHGEFDAVLEANGGDSNAYTSHDETVYHEHFASEALETVLDLEADRMRSLAISPPALERERQVVMEERRLTVENDVGGLLGEELDSLAWRVHPYRWPVIGWMDDIQAITKADCDAFFRTYYAPGNATLYLSGDFEPDRAMAWVRRKFGDIPKGPPVPPVTTREPVQRGERRALVRHPAQAPRILVAYAGPAGRSDDTLALDVVQFALAVGESSRLVQELVFRRELAVNVSMDFTWRVDPGQLTFALELKPGGDPADAERALERELDRVREERLSPRELEKAKNNLAAMAVSELATVNSRAATCAQYETTRGTWRDFEKVQARYASLTAAEVRAAAQAYLSPERRTVVTLVPA